MNLSDLKKSFKDWLTGEGQLVEWNEEAKIFRRINKIPSLRFTIVRELKEDGVLIPRGYGFAYRDFDRDVRIFYPYGINWIIWFWMNKLRYWLRYPPHDVEMHKAYARGFQCGMRAHQEYFETYLSHGEPLPPDDDFFKSFK